MKNLADNIHPLRIADARKSIRHVFVRDLMIDASIGVYAHEKEKPQPIRMNIDLSVDESLEVSDADLRSVVCYEKIVKGARAIVAAGHIHLVETLAERVADMCLGDRRVIGARVRVEKLEAVPGTASVGVEIERFSI
jgi:dihydroneopterin aldolase